MAALTLNSPMIAASTSRPQLPPLPEVPGWAQFSKEGTEIILVLYLCFKILESIL